MDSLIAASARALAAGDALGALKRVALRDDPPALALRGIAMAQLGEHPRARELLQRAARGFGAHEPLAHARCVVAEAEVALAMRDLGGSLRSVRALAAAADLLEARGAGHSDYANHSDRANALHARLIAARRLLLLGRLDEAAAMLAQVDTNSLPTSTSTSTSPALSFLVVTALAELTAAELALRSMDTVAAHAALTRARAAAERARVPALLAEVAEAQAAFERPVARRLFAGSETPLMLDEVAALLASDSLVVDACRRGLRAGDAWVSLARRPVLFALLRTLAEAWPGDVDRESLIAAAFRMQRPDETHRARLRVELGRLRALIGDVARIEATARGFILRPCGPSNAQMQRDVVLLAPPIDGEDASLLALLSDGAAWSTSALALALGDSQRTVQRALVELEATQRVRAIGQARARRWLAPPLTGFTTILLLPAALPIQ